METETYKNAKVILERFDPEAKKKAVSATVSCLLDFFFLYKCICILVLFNVCWVCLPSW